MGDFTAADFSKVRSEYGGLKVGARPEHSSGQCAYRSYKFEEAVKFDSYKMPDMGDDEIVSFYNKIRGSDMKELSEKDMHKFVSIAMCVRDPVTKIRIVKDPFTPEQLCASFSSKEPNDNNKVAMEKEIAVSASMQMVPTGANVGTSTEKIIEDAKTQADAICFLFAWMTRFAVKSPSAALGLQYNSVKSTYMKFYQKTSMIFDNFRPDAKWLNCFRNAFDSFVAVKNSLVIYVASAETATKEHPKAFNVLRYLFFQNLEFMGMHAYVSIVNIMAKVALPPGLILSWLRMSGAELAIDEAYDIMSRLDNGMIDNGATRERLWKYARILEPGYFNRLQTAHAAELMATLAYIQVFLGISEESGHNSPLNIHAIANNKSIRDIGRAKAEAFIECKNRTISLDKNASIVDKIYAKKLGKAVHTHGEQEDRAYDNMDVDKESGKRPAHQEGGSSKRVRDDLVKLPLPPKFR